MSLDYKKIVQYLFPPTEDERNIEKVLPEDLIRCMAIRCTDEVYSLMPYADIRVRSAIHLLKFHNHAHARQLLSSVLTEYLSKTISHEYLLIPIPLSKKRQRQRGYNQVTEVLKESIHSLPSGTLDQNILIRKYNTVPQTSLSREKRLHNVAGAFAVKNQEIAEQKLTGKHIILIDDVMTTGATLKAAKAALLPLHPASLTCVALAH